MQLRNSHGDSQGKGGQGSGPKDNDEAGKEPMQRHSDCGMRDASFAGLWHTGLWLWYKWPTAPSWLWELQGLWMARALEAAALAARVPVAVLEAAPAIRLSSGFPISGSSGRQRPQGAHLVSTLAPSTPEQTTM